MAGIGHASLSSAYELSLWTAIMLGPKIEVCKRTLDFNVGAYNQKQLTGCDYI